MIRIQRLKEPKRNKSGVEVVPGKTYELGGVVIKNNNTFSVFVSSWRRPGMDLVARKKKSKIAMKKIKAKI
jgi:hypothetical protein